MVRHNEKIVVKPGFHITIKRVSKKWDLSLEKVTDKCVSKVTIIITTVSAHVYDISQAMICVWMRVQNTDVEGGGHLCELIPPTVMWILGTQLMPPSLYPLLAEPNVILRAHKKALSK